MQMITCTPSYGQTREELVRETLRRIALLVSAEVLQIGVDVGFVVPPFAENELAVWIQSVHHSVQEAPRGVLVGIRTFSSFRVFRATQLQNSMHGRSPPRTASTVPSS